MRGKCGEGELAHALLHEVAGVEESGEIVPDVLDVAVGAKADGGQSRRLGLGAHDGEVDADEAVQERGLADVGCAGEGDVAGARAALGVIHSWSVMAARAGREGVRT